MAVWPFTRNAPPAAAAAADAAVRAAIDGLGDRISRELSDLRVDVARLDGRLDTLHTDLARQIEHARTERGRLEQRVTTHGQQIDDLDSRADRIESRQESSRARTLGFAAGVSAASSATIVGLVEWLGGG